MGQFKEFLEYIAQAFKIWVIVQPWEQALIVRNGKKIRKKGGGIYFKLPYFDSVYVQEARLRVVEIAIQTLTTSCGKTITLNSSFGYTIADLEKLYDTLYQPERTLSNVVSGTTANIVFSQKVEDITPQNIEEKVLKELQEGNDYGLDFQYFKLNNFAIVKTFRLIQDQSWTDHGLDMEAKK